MRIAIVGCGAVGSFYGASLCRAGQDVHFLLRSGYDAVRQHGVTIRSRDGDFRVRPKCARDPRDLGVADLVIIGLKTTANDQFSSLLPPLVAGHTAVLTLQNGLGNEEQLARLFSAKQILGGLCFVCLNRVGPGVIQHIDHGRIVLGEHLRPPEARTHDLAARFRAGGVPCEVTDDLTRAHWEKLVWNIPFNGLGVAGAAGLAALERGFVEPQASRGATLTTEQLLGDPRWEGLVRELMLEVVRVAQALGLGVSEALAETQITRSRTMGAYKASTVLDFEQGRPLELQSLFFEPLRQAKKADVPAPRLEALCAVLSALSAEPHSASPAEKA